MRRTGRRNGLRDGGRKAQKRCSVLPEPGSGGSEMTNAADGVKKRPARWRQEGTETLFCLAGTGKRRQRDDKRGGRQDTGVEREKRRRRRQASKTRAAAGKSGRPTGRRRKCRAKKRRRQGICRRKGHCPALFIGRCRCSHGSVRPRGKAGRCRPCLRQRCGRQRCRPVPMPLRRPRHAAARVSG